MFRNHAPQQIQKSEKVETELHQLKRNKKVQLKRKKKTNHQKLTLKIPGFRSPASRKHAAGPAKPPTYLLSAPRVCMQCLPPGWILSFPDRDECRPWYLGHISWAESSELISQLGEKELKIWCLQPSDAHWKLPSVIPGTPRLVVGASLEVQFSEGKNDQAGCFDVFHAKFRFKNFLGKPSKTLSSNARFARLVQFAQFALSEHAAQASRQSWEGSGDS